MMTEYQIRKVAIGLSLLLHILVLLFSIPGFSFVNETPESYSIPVRLQMTVDQKIPEINPDKMVQPKPEEHNQTSITEENKPAPSPVENATPKSKKTQKEIESQPDKTKKQPQPNKKTEAPSTKHAASAQEANKETPNAKPLVEQTQTTKEVGPIENPTPALETTDSEPNKTPAETSLPGDLAQAELSVSPTPVKPKSAINSGLSGTVTVDVLVGTDGLPKAVKVTQSSGHTILDEAFVRTVQLYYQFLPKKVMGESVEDTIKLEHHYD